MIALGRVVDDAHAEVAAAATVAISRIDGASGDGLRDSVFDDIGGAVGAAYEGFQTWMENNDGWISVVIDVASVAGIVLMGVSMFIPGVNIAAVLVAGLVLLLTTARATAGTGSWGEVAVSLMSMVLVGSGAVVGKGLRQSVSRLGVERTVQLVKSGVSPRLASAWVGKLWSRSRPGILDKSLLQALGDPFAAQVLRFIRPPRVVGIGDDAAAVADIVRQLTSMRRIQASDVILNGLNQIRSISQDAMKQKATLMVGGQW